MIVDASVWIDYQRGGHTAATLLLLDHVRRTRPVYLIPAILQEVLQGAASAERFTASLRLFSTFPCLNVDRPARTAADAALLYARCRWQGVTPRSTNDCLIAASCIELAQPLLHNDADFVRIASVEPRLKLLEPAH